MLIGELAKKTNTTKDTIRHYDDMGLLVSSQRQAGSRVYKEFSQNNLERIEMIRVAKFMGFTLSEVAKQIEAYYAGDISQQEQIQTLQARLEDVEGKIQNLLTVKSYMTQKIALISEGQVDAATCLKMQSLMTESA